MLALLAGTLTILAPCTLPVVPLVLGAGAGERRRRPLVVALGFAGSFATVTVMLAAMRAALGLSSQVDRRFPTVVFVTVATLGSCSLPSARAAVPSPQADPLAVIVPGPLATTTAPAAAPPCVLAAAIVAVADRADHAMREIAVTGSIGDARATAASLADLIRKLLPSDTDGPPDGPVAALITRTGAAAAELDNVALGGLATWSRPRERWDQWRAVLAAWRPDRNTMPELPSHLLRALGWATLVAQSDDLGSARGLASTHGVVHTGLVLDAARTVATRAEAACP